MQIALFACPSVRLSVGHTGGSTKNGLMHLVIVLRLLRHMTRNALYLAIIRFSYSMHQLTRVAYQYIHSEY